MHRDAWLDTLRFLASTPDGPDTRRVLSALNAQQLFRAALISRRLYGVVSEYLDHLKDCGVESEDGFSDVDEEEDPPPTKFVAGTRGEGGRSLVPTVDTLPTELGHIILQDLDLADRLRFAQVSRNAALATADSLQAAAVAVLRRFDLRFGEIRLMQTATGALVGGSSVAAIMSASTSWPSSSFDVYTGRGSGWDVVRFLRKGGDYRLTHISSTHNVLAGIRKVFTMRNHGTCKVIHVIESLTNNPLDAIAHCPSTCVFGAWSARGVWHAYPRLTMAGVTITTPSRMPLRDDLKRHRDVWRIVRRYTERGFRFVLDEYEQSHTCGRALNCPGTFRSSDDRGCLFMPFPSWDFDRDATVARGTCWSLKGTGCPSGILAQSTIQSHSAHAAVEQGADRGADFYWLHMIGYYSRRTTAPQELLTIQSVLD
ncbi:hypothetical protein DFH06DRAFT_1135698 [Mycena polygramma]|nr:hypothetical protein DFH06DRAFT_1135698 [Mycena polygramma]